MIDLDVGKLLLVALIALIVLGPQKLPVAARTAGAILRRARAGWDSVRTEVEHELQLEELKQMAKTASGQAKALESAVRTDKALGEVTAVTHQLMSELAGVEAAAKAYTQQFTAPVSPRPTAAANDPVATRPATAAPASIGQTVAPMKDTHDA